MQLQHETNLLNILVVLHTCYYLHLPLLEFPLYISVTCTAYILYNHQFFCLSSNVAYEACGDRIIVCNIFCLCDSIQSGKLVTI